MDQFKKIELAEIRQERKGIPKNIPIKKRPSGALLRENFLKIKRRIEKTGNPIRLAKISGARFSRAKGLKSGLVSWLKLRMWMSKNLIPESKPSKMATPIEYAEDVLLPKNSVRRRKTIRHPKRKIVSKETR